MESFPFPNHVSSLDYSFPIEPGHGLLSLSARSEFCLRELRDQAVSRPVSLKRFTPARRQVLFVDPLIIGRPLAMKLIVARVCFKECGCLYQKIGTRTLFKFSV